MTATLLLGKEETEAVEKDVGDGRCPKPCLSNDDDEEGDIMGSWASFPKDDDNDDDDDDSLTEDSFAEDFAEDDVSYFKSRDWLLLGIDEEENEGLLLLL